MKKILLIPAFIATLIMGLVVGQVGVSANNNDHPQDVVGAWFVNAEGAPYIPHLFTFNSDGTMLTTNPTNVQEDPAQPHGGSNDSVGMGTWRVQNDHGQKFVVGTFKQLNANADDHLPTDTLSVTFKISMDGDQFNGPAQAKLGPLTGPATLSGNRIQIDQAALDSL
jgi:hypothetical protein